MKNTRTYIMNVAARIQRGEIDMALLNQHVQKTPNSHAGFTLIELLVVIAIISVLVGLLFPAVQKVREANAATQAQSSVNFFAACAKGYHNQSGRFPAGLQELVDFSSQNPSVCTLDSQLATGRKQGYTFYFGTTDNGGVWIVQVEPDVPGIDGSMSFLYELRKSNGEFVSSLTSNPTPGADKAREEVMARIKAEGAQTVSELFQLLPDATIEARSFFEMPTTRDQVLRILDRNGDGNMSFFDLYDWPGAYPFRFDGVSPELEEPLREFLIKVSQELKLETMDQQSASDAHIGIGVLRSMDGGRTWFTLEGLCELTDLHVSDKKVASDLCKSLTLAAAAKERGDLRTRDRLLAGFFNDLEQQVHKTITRKNATMLVWVTLGFFETRF